MGPNGSATGAGVGKTLVPTWTPDSVGRDAWAAGDWPGLVATSDPHQGDHQNGCQGEQEVGRPTHRDPAAMLGRRHGASLTLAGRQ